MVEIVPKVPKNIIRQNQHLKQRMMIGSLYCGWYHFNFKYEMYLATQVWVEAERKVGIQGAHGVGTSRKLIGILKKCTFIKFMHDKPQERDRASLNTSFDPK